MRKLGFFASHTCANMFCAAAGTRSWHEQRIADITMLLCQPNYDVASIVNMFIRRGKPAIEATKFLIAKVGCSPTSIFRVHLRVVAFPLAELICPVLYQAALAWRTEEGDYRDDITVIVIYLKDLHLSSTTPRSKADSPAKA
eukprot:7161467-Prymnesium_polylepis.1